MKYNKTASSALFKKQKSFYHHKNWGKYEKNDATLKEMPIIFCLLNLDSSDDSGLLAF